jgi:hypothetical protein
VFDLFLFFAGVWGEETKVVVDMGRGSFVLGEMIFSLF